MNLYLNYLSKFMLLISLVFALSMKSFISMWIFMELNLLSFLMWQFSIGDKMSLVKYFLIQAFFSTTLLFLFMLSMIDLNSKILNLLIFLTLLSKLGTPPVYIWFINFCLAAQFKNIFLAATLQKLIPYLMMNNFNFKINIFWTLATLIISVMGMHRNLHLKTILAFSSMFNMVWIIMSLTNFNMMMAFMLLYSFNMAMFISFITQNFNSLIFSDMFMSSHRLSHIFLTLILILSMMGVPPFTGFFSKILIMEYSLTLSFLTPLIFLLLMTSGWMTFNYLRILFLTYSINHHFNFNKSHKYFQYNYFIFIVNMFPIFMIL